MSYRLESNYKRLGGYIKRINNRNKLGVVSNLQGININKHFMPSVANVIGTDLTRYKIVEPNQFACNRMHVGRDYRLPIAVSKFDNSIIVSPAYDVFKIKDENKLNVDYLMMWVSRAEFDRNCWFYTDTDIRGKLGWDSFCDMRLPIPSIEKQNEIVKEYNTIVNRIELNETLNQKLEETAQALYKHWFVDFEFPNEDGEPYKSSGGKMVYCEEVDGEIPKNWELVQLSKLVQTQYGYTASASNKEVGPKFLRITDIAQNHIKWMDVPYCEISEKDFQKYQVDSGDILIARTGATAGYGKRIHKNFPKSVFASYLVRVLPNEKSLSLFLGLIIDSEPYRDFITSNAGGSAQPQANAILLTSYEVLDPEKSVIHNFNLKVEPVVDLIEYNNLENSRLLILKDLLLAKMTKLKIEELSLN